MRFLQIELNYGVFGSYRPSCILFFLSAIMKYLDNCNELRNYTV